MRKDCYQPLFSRLLPAPSASNFVTMTNKVGTSIRLRGVRHNNLKNFDLDLPVGRLIVLTGLSGSGKSSLAFDTLFAEGQRRYIETFSPYARQFFDRMDKPRVDRIEGIPPAIAIEQRNSVKSTRSTVGTMTELCDYMKLLWPHLARLYCRQCGQVVRKDTPKLIWETVRERDEATPSGPPGQASTAQSARTAEAGASGGSPEVLITFNLPLSEKLSLEESLALISKQGYQRLLFDGQIVRLEEAATRHTRSAEPVTALTVIQDRLRLAETNRARFVEACEHAYHFGKGRLAVRWLQDGPTPIARSQSFSSHFHCAQCDLDYQEPSPALFSFNHPIGACPTCRGFGRTITIDYDLAIPDRSKTLEGGAVKPWQTGQGAECQADLTRACRQKKIRMDVPFARLPAKAQEWVIGGDPDYGKDKAHEWPRAWYGIKGYFRWLESRAYKMHVRVLLSRYRSYSTCADCQGRRFQAASLLFKVPAANGKLLTLADFYQFPVEEALKFIDAVVEGAAASAPGPSSTKNPSAPVKAPARPPADPMTIALGEVRARLGYLLDVGLGYLTLDRPTRSLSGGETERVNLTTCLGTRLVNTLFVLDEPSVGLHPRDTARLVRILENLRDTGNTVVVVEHEASVMRAADQLLDIGPGQGAAGGHIVFQGTFPALLKHPHSLTGQYLSGAKEIRIPTRRPVKRSTPRLVLEGASRHNLKHLSIGMPLNRFVCLTGVSGSGKTTLAREELLPKLEEHFRRSSAPSASVNGDNEPGEQNEDTANDPAGPEPEKRDAPGAKPLGRAGTTALTGAEQLGRVVLVDQATLGKTPRSNPVVYIGAFEDIRELFAQTDRARQRGLNSSAFSFNSAQGQCEGCRGAGFEKVEMQFLSDVYIRCPECDGRRYRPHILEVKLMVSDPRASAATRAKRKPGSRQWSIADLLEATVDEAIVALGPFEGAPPGRRAIRSLKLLQEVGLGYLRLGQPINTLSGGESQRLKLVSHLAEFERTQDTATKPTLFVFDEPTTGLHFDDIRVLLQVFQRLVDSGHSLLVIEHNLDLIKCADWILDLGPEAGEKGGRLVAQGTPEQVAGCAESHTGRALREMRVRAAEAQEQLK